MKYYYYLISSLPALKRDEAPVFSLERFLKLCAEHLPSSDMDFINKLPLVPNMTLKVKHGSLSAHWFAWEIYLRNKLAVLRSSELGWVVKEYLLPQDEKVAIGELEREINEKLLGSDPFERERLLDRLRWSKLDELEFGHYFDFDILCSYKLKLMIREKWGRRNAEKGALNISSIVDKIFPA